LKKGLARLIFLVVFLIPVGWYLFLQLFGSNSFAIELKASINPQCGLFEEIAVITKGDSVSLSKKNYLDRVTYAVERKSIRLEIKDQFFFDCINQPASDLVLVDERGVWGGYTLSRDGVDLLLTELDILLLQKSYGQGTDR